MKIAERIVMISLVLVLIGGFLWLYLGVQSSQQAVKDAVARGEYETPVENNTAEIAPSDWRAIYPVIVPINIGEVPALASVADTLSERMKGLSETPFLPDNVVKLFAFGATGTHSIWMKDMKYPLDIIWITQGGEIVHIEENVPPDSYPKSFSSPKPAWYVIEANAGFVASNTIAVGDEVVLDN